MKKNKDNSPDIYENIDRFLCHEMNSTEERNFLDLVSMQSKIHDKAALNVMMIKAVLNRGQKADSDLMNAILYGCKDDIL